VMKRFNGSKPNIKATSQEQVLQDLRKTKLSKSWLFCLLWIWSARVSGLSVIPCFISAFCRICSSRTAMRKELTDWRLLCAHDEWMIERGKESESSRLSSVLVNA
jgi:hypothetical protein